MTAPRVILRRRAAALVVELEPADAALARFSKTFILPARANKRFSRAAGYACELAARYGLEFEDRTGRLSPAHCAALVDDWRGERTERVMA